MITLENDGSGNSLVFRFPDVHEDAVLEITFQRTLRLPDDGEYYPLPPGFSSFPLRHLDDYADKLPESWRRRGGVIMPMYQSEALWIRFRTGGGWRWEGYPFAVKVAAGKINAVTGEPWRPGLHRAPQDYLVVPKQPWLDGFCVAKGVIRQFVAMPLGEGFTAEEQLSETAEWGGIQLLVHPLRGELWRPVRAHRGGPYCLVADAPADMGLAPGGRMRQEIYADERHLEDWDQRRAGRCFVTILNATQWAAVTGEAPPHRPPTAAEYSKAGLPWFDWYDAEAKALEGSPVLAGLKGVAAVAAEKGLEPDPADTETVRPTLVRRLRPTHRPVREAEL